MELKTGDTKSTPLLLAAAVGNLTVVRRLIELGSRPDAVDAKAVGVVEICVQRENEAILRYLACLDHEKLNFWKRLAKLLRTDFDEDAEHAARCFEMLMNRDDEADSEDKVLPTKETSSVRIQLLVLVYISVMRITETGFVFDGGTGTLCAHA